MLVCSGCNRGYSDDFAFCPYCGKAKVTESLGVIDQGQVHGSPRYEHCVLKDIVESEKPEGIFRKFVQPMQWICIVAVHQSSGTELFRADTAANLYLYWHGSPKQKEGVKAIIEAGKTQVWQFLERNGWEYYDSSRGAFLPEYLFRRSAQS